MSRLIIRWTDPHERPHDWPFVSNGREVASVEVDGVEYVNDEKLKAVNGELCAEVNELEKLVKKFKELVRDVRFCSNVPKCSVCPCLWDDSCSMEFNKRIKALGIEEDA